MIRKSAVVSEIPSSWIEEACADSSMKEDVSSTVRGGTQMDVSSNTESVWKQAPSFMQLLLPSHVVMVKECGGGGDCFYGIVSWTVK